MLRKIFPPSPYPSLTLNPDAIHRYAEQAGKTLEWEPCEWWEGFGLNKYSDAEIMDFILGPYKLESGDAIIVTDECWPDQEAYVVASERILEFIEEDYSEMHNMEFFQPSDTIFLFPSQSLLIVLHHEGCVARYEGILNNLKLQKSGS